MLRLIAFTASSILLTATLSSAPPAQTSSTDPLAVARILAGKYPAQPAMSYIPALTWSNGLRLSSLTNDPRWRDKALAEMQPFLSGQAPAITEPHRLTSFAGALAFADAASIAGRADAGKLAEKVAVFIIPQQSAELVRFATGWTDDMFMAAALLSRVEQGKHAGVVGRLLTTYAVKLQRPDGLFIHAVDAPHAWGRGNGFALLGLTEALTHLPQSWSDRAKVLALYRSHVDALERRQSDDGSWRQVIDEPTSYREATATAMITAALARGVRSGWIDRDRYLPVINRGWVAVATRVNPDGTVRDVCSGTGAQASREYYLNRPVINGADDRGGAMALLAAVEVRMMRNSFR